MQEVHLDPVALDRLAGLIAPERAERLKTYVEQAQAMLAGRTVWNVNATARGGGVAEMLLSLLAYTLGSGVQTRWLVLDGEPAFFDITKRIHNVMHGMPGDGGPLGPDEHAAYDAVLERNAADFVPMVSPGDIVILHDPQTAGLVAPLMSTGARVVWRSHIGRDTPNDYTDLGWSFLRPYVEPADAFIFSRTAYVPDFVPAELVSIIPPSLDPFSAKNAEIADIDVGAILAQAAIVDGDPHSGSLAFPRRDGSTGTIRPHTGIIRDGSALPGDARIVLQVSRWDRLKDMDGVMKGFADNIDLYPDDVHLILAGPDVAGVSDDPEGAQILVECEQMWAQMPASTRARVHLACLPMDDTDENAFLVNALQRRASVVVQKSIVEGFGLTVTEPMWKGKAMVASAVGGIADQIVDAQCGLLLRDPTDLDSFAELLHKVLIDDGFAASLGAAAHERVRDRYLGDRHLMQYVDLFTRLDAAASS